MADRDCRDVGSADRRRERRLRSRMTVAAELAAALHQSCDGEADYARPTGTESSGGLRPALLIEVVPGRMGAWNSLILKALYNYLTRPT